MRLLFHLSSNRLKKPCFFDIRVYSLAKSGTKDISIVTKKDICEEDLTEFLEK